MKYKACQKCAETVGMVTAIGNIVMIVLKGYLGVVGGSKGLIADAIHSCADLLAAIVMMIGRTISGQEKDEQYPYGYGKSEYIVALIIYLSLFVIGAYILYDGIEAILTKHSVEPCFVTLWGALFSIAINELMFRQGYCAATQINSPSMMAVALESRADVYSSIAVVIGIIGAKLGFHFMDPLAAVIVGLQILKICVEMSKEAILNLMDRAPNDIDPEELREKILAKAGDRILDVKNIQVREIGDAMELGVEIDVADHLTVAESENIREFISQAVMGLFEKKSSVNVILVPIAREMA